MAVEASLKGNLQSADEAIKLLLTEEQSWSCTDIKCFEPLMSI